MRHFRVSLVIVFNCLITSLGATQCGVRKMNVNRVIVRGQPTYPGEWPWHVAVYHRSGVSDSYACGGTLISEFFVLTADHCTKGNNGFVLSTRRIFVRVGMHNFQDPDPHTFQQHGIHKTHQFEESKNLKNDIALLELSTKVSFTNYVQPVCLNEVEDLTNQYGVAVGWGITEHDDVSPVLKGSLMPVVSTVQCLESNDGVFRQVLDSSTFCAGYLNGTTVCNGDSGGGLHFERHGVWYVGGVIAFTAPRDSDYKCHTKSYAGFTNVYRFTSWISAVTGLNQNIDAGRSNLLPHDCGQYLVNRIARGSTSNPYEFPWMALIITLTTTGRTQYSTSGSLVHQRYVLTVAPLEDFSGLEALHFVRLGEYNTWDKECHSLYEDYCELNQDIIIENVAIHPEFDANSFKNNIALIRLAKDATFNDHVQPICLPTTNIANSEYIIAGWGASETGGDYSGPLQKATVPTISLSECQPKFDNESQIYVGEGVICTGMAGTPNTCEGDWGTPLGNLYQYPDKSVRFVQYGITSLAWCGNGPSIYTDVAYYMDWILTNIEP